MGNGARRKRADWVQVDGWHWASGCVHYSRDRGGRRGRGQWDLDSSGHGDGAGDTEALLLVCLEHVGEAKSLAAHVTRVGLLACVSSAVPLHVWAAGEALATDFTDKGLLSCKQSQQSVRHRTSANPYTSAHLRKQTAAYKGYCDCCLQQTDTAAPQQPSAFLKSSLTFRF